MIKKIRFKKIKFGVKFEICLKKKAKKSPPALALQPLAQSEFCTYSAIHGSVFLKTNYT